MKAAKYCFRRPDEEENNSAGEDLNASSVDNMAGGYDEDAPLIIGKLADYLGPLVTRLGKYNGEGFASEGTLMGLGIHPSLAGLIAFNMNMGLSKATKEQYKTAINHIHRAEKALEVDLSLPWTVGKTLNYVGFLLENRKCSSKTISCYLSGIRMLHLCNGQDPASLRPDIVNLVLRGREHFEEARATLEQKQKRVAVTVPILKVLLRKIRESTMDSEMKTRLWLICCLMWNASLRVSEVLSKNEKEYDPLTTLCGGDLILDKVEVRRGEYKEILRYHIKSPKERRIGNGVKLEIFENGSFCCPVRAYKAWSKKVTLVEKKPVFMDSEKKCFTGKAFNRILSKLTACMTDDTDGVIKSHSFRSGVATEMGKMGFTEQEIMAQGRWSSQAFKSYTKQGILKKLQLAERMRALVSNLTFLM